MFIKSLAVAAALFTAGMASAATNIDFNDGTAPGFTGNYNLYVGSIPNVTAQVNDTKYLSVPSGSATFTSARGLTSFSFDWGTPDSYNTLTFNGANGFTQSFTGAGKSAGRVTYNFATAAGVNSVTFGSSTAAFEIDNVTAGVPEPATWGLLLTGFAMVGAASRRRVRSLAA